MYIDDIHENMWNSNNNTIESINTLIKHIKSEKEEMPKVIDYLQEIKSEFCRIQTNFELP